LLAVTVSIFAVTLLLFRSFTAHRAVLAERWASRGRSALTARQPEQAVTAYRAALQYAPGDANDQLMLATALADAGRTEEATNYFLEMWAVHPGDGLINLQLARLTRQKGDVQAAVNYYRGALYGTWEGDGVVRRRGVRLELAEFLIAAKQYGPARAELLILGGNTPETAAFDDALAQRLNQAQAPSDALTFYRKALAIDPDDLTALRAAARLAFAAADYPNAEALLERATARHPPGFEDDQALLDEARQRAEPQTPEDRRKRPRRRRR
jgi:tetratricopeptide (TPR) repeat protein